MRPLLIAERACTIGHIFAMVFGLAGLVLVLPHPEFIASLPAIGQQAFGWSMAGGGVVYMVLGAAAVALYAYRVYGWGQWLAFMLPAIFISLGSELLGTGTGFPFGEYHYLSGLGYKISGRVPFTIPLSWFYVGFVTYAIARAALDSRQPRLPRWGRIGGAIALGSLLLTFWDFVLDPAMSQTALPFWYWHEPGAFFGMPYQNFAGWLATGALFMGVAALLWRRRPLGMRQAEVTLPLVVYLGNFSFAMVMSLAAGYWVPILLGLILGVIPAVLCWQQSRQNTASFAPELQDGDLKSATTNVARAPFGVPGE